MTPIRIFLFGASALALAACAADGAPPPEISYDSDDFAAAAVELEPSRPVEIVTLPEPLPLPGQLKPAPDRDTAAPDKRPPPARVDAANKAARLEPTRHGYVNAVQVYPFTPGAPYRLSAAPAQVKTLALRTGVTIAADPAATRTSVGRTGVRQDR